jgi:hypothetical protein
MEKEGLIRSVEFFNQNNIKIKTLVTDRHTSIRKWISENMAQKCFPQYGIPTFFMKLVTDGRTDRQTDR